MIYVCSGKVPLISSGELSAGWNPAKDRCITAREATQSLLRALDKGDESGTAGFSPPFPTVSPTRPVT